MSSLYIGRYIKK